MAPARKLILCILLLHRTCRPISTEGKAAILRRKIVADNFPDWRTNCFLVKIADSAYSPAVFIHPEAALKVSYDSESPLALDLLVI